MRINFFANGSFVISSNARDPTYFHVTLLHALSFLQRSSRLFSLPTRRVLISFRTVRAFSRCSLFVNLPFSHSRAQTHTHIRQSAHTHTRALTLSLLFSLSLSLSFSHTHAHTHTHANKHLYVASLGIMTPINIRFCLAYFF